MNCFDCWTAAAPNILPSTKLVIFMKRSVRFGNFTSRWTLPTPLIPASARPPGRSVSWEPLPLALCSAYGRSCHLGLMNEDDATSDVGCAVSTFLNWTAGPPNTGMVMLTFVHVADRRAERIHTGRIDRLGASLKYGI